MSSDHLTDAIRQFERTGGKGLNITVPHKQAVIPLCSSLSDRARTAGAANTLSFRNGEVLGDNHGDRPKMPRLLGVLKGQDG